MVRSHRSIRRSPPDVFAASSNKARHASSSGFVRYAFGAAFVLGAAGLASACGSRGPLDDDARLSTLSDASVPLDGAPDRLAPSADAQAEGGSIIGCGTCLVTQCARGVAKCVQDATCRTTLQCAATSCLGGASGPSPACLFKCASGDVEGALAIVEVVRCVTGTCGTDCNPVVSGGLGRGGLGGLAEVGRRVDLP